jgi:hypothetical protein
MAMAEKITDDAPRIRADRNEAGKWARMSPRSANWVESSPEMAKIAD